MSKKEKLLARILTKPKDFTYDELRKLLNGFDYIEDNSGKSSGSRVAWIHEKGKHVIRLHKPHPGNILKSYQINQILDELKSEGYIE